MYQGLPYTQTEMIHFPGPNSFSYPLKSVQSLSYVWLFVTPWTAGFPVHHQIPELAQTHAHPVGDAIQPSCPLLFPSTPAFNLFQHQGLLQSVSSLHQAKYWGFSFSISPSNEYLGVISFRIDWLDLLAVQGTLKSLLQHHCPKASVILLSAFFMVQLSHPYMTTGKTTALTGWTFVSKVISLLFNMAFLNNNNNLWSFFPLLVFHLFSLYCIQTETLSSLFSTRYL